MSPSSNFAPIASSLPGPAELAMRAEQYLADDPRGAMMQLRLFGEMLCRRLLERHGKPAFGRPAKDERKLREIKHVRSDVLSAFKDLRTKGNGAAHTDGRVDTRTALFMLKRAHHLSVWYWKTYIPTQQPAPGPFVLPSQFKQDDDQRLKRTDAALTREQSSQASHTLPEAEALARAAMPQVSVHHGMTQAFQALPDDARNAIAVFLEQFRTLPIDERWPMEPVPDVQDDKIRLVHHGGLAIVIAVPEDVDILFVMWVGTPAQAAHWARSRRLEVHPLLGSIQSFDATSAERIAEGDGGLFAYLSDEDLHALGVPKALLPSVRVPSKVAHLGPLAPFLPADALHALYLLASGRTLEQTRTLLSIQAAKDTDPHDFGTAVHHPVSRNEFAIADTSADLETVLRGDVEAWRIYLHPQQRSLITREQAGPVRVLGGAGTGKTVALLHRAAHLLRNVFDAPDDHILITTFTRTLTADLQAQMARLVTPEELARVTITNLHQLAGRFVGELHAARPLIEFHQRRALWAEVEGQLLADAPAGFLEEEWEQVVRGEDVRDEMGYLNARRAHRPPLPGHLSPQQIWSAFAAYRAKLDALEVWEGTDRLTFLREAIHRGRMTPPFKAVLVDETQDFHAPELRFLRALVPEGPNDMFLVGDAHQRIYGHPVPLSACGIHTEGRTHELTVNYRTTGRVRELAVGALAGEAYDDMDGGTGSLLGYHSLRMGTRPVVRMFDHPHDETRYLLGLLTDWLRTGPAEHICVAFPRTTEAQAFAELLRQAGAKALLLDRDTSSGPGIRVSNLHRLKGLEFPRVILAHIQDGTMPIRHSRWDELSDEAKALSDKQQRCLFYVAASRARDELVVTGSGNTSPLLTPTEAG